MLKSRYKDHIEAVVMYAKTIDDFDDLVDPQTLACHCLGPKPSAFVLQAIAIEDKSECYHTSLSFPSLSLFYFLFFLNVSLLFFHRDHDKI